LLNARLEVSHQYPGYGKDDDCRPLLTHPSRGQSVSIAIVLWRLEWGSHTLTSRQNPRGAPPIYRARVLLNVPFGPTKTLPFRTSPLTAHHPWSCEGAMRFLKLEFWMEISRGSLPPPPSHSSGRNNK
jgi:hypothetical protein